MLSLSLENRKILDGGTENEEEKQFRRREEQLKRKKQEEIEIFYRNIDDISKDLKF